MKMVNQLTAVMALFFIILIYSLREYLKLQWMVFIIISRGILAPHKFWWRVSELTLRDASGIHFYQQLKRKSHRKIVSTQFFKTTIHTVTDLPFINQILQQSPQVFGVGLLKKIFFQSFMDKNVGVSNGPEWVRRRRLNEIVLETDRVHRFVQHWHQEIGHLLKVSGKLPSTYRDFEPLAQLSTLKIVFGDQPTDANKNIFKVFAEANSFYAILTRQGKDLQRSRNFQEYQHYLQSQIDDPKPNSLMAIADSHGSDQEELRHQIPHWMFPLVGSVLNNLPRLLLLLNHHPEKLTKLIQELDQIDSGSARSLHQCRYLRQCLLETLRLNNPVVTSFRTLLTDYSFDEHYRYPAGTQFLILNNAILRDPECWEQADQFQPERWTPALEQEICALMFNQGPQRCPGKELAIFIVISFVGHLHQSMDFLRKLLEQTGQSQPVLNPLELRQMINPFSIRLI